MADAVIRELNLSGEPVFLTHHGRFVAVITPLAANGVESLALSFAAAAGYPDVSESEDMRATTESEPMSTAEARRQLQT